MGFPVSIPTEDAAVVLKADVVEASAGDLAWWHTHVQPEARARDQIDARWNWPQIVAVCGRFERMRGRLPVCLVLRAENPATRMVPIGLALYSVGYPWALDHEQRSVFVWFVSALPKDLAPMFGFGAPPKALRALLQCGHELAAVNGFGQRVWLHAASHRSDPEKSAALTAMYRHLGWQALPEDAALPGVRTLVNDGRYFVLG